MNVVKTLLLESFRVIEIPIRYVQNLRKKISYHLPIYRSSLLLHRILYSMRLQLAHTGTDDIVSISVQYLSTSISFVLRAIFLNRNRRKLTSTHTSNFFSKRLSAQQKFFDQNFEKKKKKIKPNSIMEESTPIMPIPVFVHQHRSMHRQAHASSPSPR